MPVPLSPGSIPPAGTFHGIARPFPDHVHPAGHLGGVGQGHAALRWIPGHRAVTRIRHRGSSREAKRGLGMSHRIDCLEPLSISPRQDSMFRCEFSSSLPSIVPFSLLKPFFRPHFRDEVQVIVKVLVNVTETIKQAASGTLIALPATIQPLVLNTRPDRTLWISPTLPTG